MIKNHLLILFRNLSKNKIVVLINVLGLSTAIGCCVVAYFLYDFNASFDSNHANTASVYRVNSIGELKGTQREFGMAPLPLYDEVKQNCKDVAHLSRFSKEGVNFRIGKEIYNVNTSYVDNDFFTLFTFDFIHGSATALTNKNTIVVSDQFALNYFGRHSAIGEVISRLTDTATKTDFEVVGVFKTPPFNSSFSGELYTLYDNYWDASAELSGEGWKKLNTLFVSIPGANHIPTVEKQLQPFTENNNKVEGNSAIHEFKLDPFLGMAVRDELSKRYGTRSTRGAASLVAIAGFAIMGVLVLLIACFNLTNTAITLSQKRLKEIGIRKVMGSVRAQLIFQYISETLVICFAALLIGFFLADSFLIPSFNELWPMMKIEADYFGKPDFLIFITSILLITGILAGSYPAFYVSKFNPVTILKGKQQFGGNNMVTYFLLVVQLMLSLVGIVCGIALIDNAHWQRNFDMGFAANEGIITYVNNASEYELFRNALATNPDIQYISGSPHHFQSSFYEGQVEYKGYKVATDIMDVGDHYLEATGMTLLSGRFFNPDSETDRNESILVSEEFVRQFGWDNPLGKRLIFRDSIKLYVIGVVKDIYSVWEPLAPMVLRYAKDKNVQFVLVRAPKDKVQGVNQFMQAKWKTVFPNRLYTSRFMNSGIQEADMVNNNLLIMFLFLGAMAMILSISGLFTMVSLNINKRMKEIGIRKLLGASIYNILRIINGGFVVIVVIACLSGAYAGDFLSDILMRNIWDHHQEPTTITIMISCASLIFIAILSIASKTISTANMNPADVIKDE
jgi:putative ABC transport system permease protein